MSHIHSLERETLHLGQPRTFQAHSRDGSTADETKIKILSGNGLRLHYRHFFESILNGNGQDNDTTTRKTD